MTKLETTINKLQLLGCKLVNHNDWAISYMKPNNTYSFIDVTLSNNDHLRDIAFLKLTLTMYFAFGPYVINEGSNMPVFIADDINYGIWIRGNSTNLLKGVNKGSVIRGMSKQTCESFLNRKQVSYTDEAIVFKNVEINTSFVVTNNGVRVPLPAGVDPSLITKNGKSFKVFERIAYADLNWIQVVGKDKIVEFTSSKDIVYTEKYRSRKIWQEQRK